MASLMMKDGTLIPLSEAKAEDLPVGFSHPLYDGKAFVPQGSYVPPAEIRMEDVGGEDYSGWSVADLKAEAQKRSLNVEGTGENGRVLRADLIAALSKDI